MVLSYHHVSHQNVSVPPLCSFSCSQLFDAFKARLQESNAKVNLHALESLQKIIPLLKDNLSQVVNILVPAIMDNHLNSKNNAIYSAAVEAIDALILNLGTLQVFLVEVRGFRCNWRTVFA